MPKEMKNSQHSILLGWEWSPFNQINIDTVKKKQQQQKTNKQTTSTKTNKQTNKQTNNNNNNTKNPQQPQQNKQQIPRTTGFEKFLRDGVNLS